MTACAYDFTNEAAFRHALTRYFQQQRTDGRMWGGCDDRLRRAGFLRILGCMTMDAYGTSDFERMWAAEAPPTVRANAYFQGLFETMAARHTLGFTGPYHPLRLFSWAPGWPR